MIKTESEGPYTEIRGWHGDGCDSGCSMDTIEGPGFDKLPQKVFREFDLAMLLNLAHAEGHKAERERCAKIAESYVAKFNCLQIADAIRGGQDGE